MLTYVCVPNGVIQAVADDLGPQVPRHLGPRQGPAHRLRERIGRRTCSLLYIVFDFTFLSGWPDNVVLMPTYLTENLHVGSRSDRQRRQHCRQPVSTRRQAPRVDLFAQPFSRTERENKREEEGRTTRASSMLCERVSREVAFDTNIFQLSSVPTCMICCRTPHFVPPPHASQTTETVVWLRRTISIHVC